MSLEFIDIDIDLLNRIEKDLYKENSFMCDYTKGILIMWNDFYKYQVAFIDDNNFILRAKFDENSNNYSYYFPFGDDYLKGLKILNEYILKKKEFPLEFACLSSEHLEILRDYYKNYYFTYDRMWSDYLYLNNDFVEFKGKKYQSKRHHKNRFSKNYPNVRFIKSSLEDRDEISKCIDFIDEFKKSKIFNRIGEKEEDEAKYILNKLKELNFELYILYDEDKIIGLSVVEIVNDCLFDHIEKCDKSYDGIYPYFVNQIATFNKDRVKYFNREDDSGDLGLRYSKEEYHPIEMIDKIALTVLNNLTYVEEINDFNVNHEISLKKIREIDKRDYFLLSTDKKRNKLRGYDYNKDLKPGQIADENYFYDVVLNDFKAKTGISWMIFYQDKFAGEIIIYNYKNDNSLELGIRIKEEFEGKNIAFSAVSYLLKWLKEEVKLSKVNMKCFKENKKSDALITRLNFEFLDEDETFKYFELTLN